MSVVIADGGAGIKPLEGEIIFILYSEDLLPLGQFTLGTHHYNRDKEH